MPSGRTLRFLRQGQAAKPAASINVRDPDTALALRSAGLPANATRIRVLVLMRDFARPMTPNALHEELRGEISRVSVYRPLAELARGGLLSSFRLPGGKIIYSTEDLDGALRMTCPRCGNSRKCASPSLASALKEACASIGFTGNELLILAECKKCASQGGRQA